MLHAPPPGFTPVGPWLIATKQKTLQKKLKAPLTPSLFPPRGGKRDGVRGAMQMRQ